MLSHEIVRAKDGAQPSFRSELNLHILCETGIDREWKDSRAYGLLLLNAAGRRGLTGGS
jgi:hypothetical protein